MFKTMMRGQLACLFACILLLAPAVLAQTITTGELVGTVTDPSGAVVTAGTVTLQSAASGQTQTSTTSTAGEFHFSLLSPGLYTLTVEAKGFSKQQQKVTVGLGQIANAKVQLGLATQTETVTVETQAAMIQTDNGNMATTFDSSQLANLPAPGNDMTSYALTAPGVTVSTGGGYGNFTVFGLPGVSNLFTINGTDNMDPYLNLNNSGASNLTLGSNEIQEAAVIINGYTGQYGRQAGAQVNYVTKSGTNDFHGNAAFYYNERVLNANDFFNNNQDTPRPFAISREWAGSIGGHIIKNKLFFYYNNEGMRYVLPSGGPVYIPTSDFSTYVLNGLKTTNAAAVPLYTTALGLYGNSSGAARARAFTKADDPALGCGDFAGGGFGTTKPCAAVFQSSVNNLNIERLQSIRGDYNFTDKDRLYVRYNDDHGVQATSTDPISTAFSANSVQPSYGGQIGYTRIISPTMVNDLRLSTSYYTAIFGPPDYAGAISTFPTTWAFADGAGYANMGGTDNSYPQGRKVRQYQFVDDYSIAHGKHTIKVGLNLRLNYVNTYATLPNTAGLLTFNSMTDFVNGSLANGSTFNQNFPNVGAEPLRMYSLGFYAQDEWKVRPNLTFTLALRLDRNSNITCGSPCFNELGSPFAAASHNQATPYNGSIQSTSTAFPSVQSIVPAPRVGMAYSVTKSTVIRGGFGIFSDLYQGLIADRFITNSPAVPSFTTTSGVVALTGSNSIFGILAGSNQTFRNGFKSGATLAQLQASLAPIPFAAPTFSTVENQLLNPKYYEWNLEVQQSLSKNYMVSLNYVGNHGVDEINQNPLINGYAASFQGMPTAAPDARFGQVRELNSIGYSYYDGMVASFQWHMGHQFSGRFNFDWGHALDTCSNSCLEPFNAITAVSVRNQLSPLGLRGVNYGAADYDTRHTVNANYLYTTPGHLGNKVLNSVFGNWTVAGTILFHSGYPFSVVNTGVRSQVKNVTGITSAVVLADYISSTPYPSCTTPDVSCYSKSLFATASAQHDWGNIPRNSFRGPGYFDTDLNINKIFPIHERYQLKVGAYFFNILNHPNFDLPTNNIASGVFGQILDSVSPPSSAYGSFQGSAVSGRLVQLLVKFQF
jgi:hypothetical protein